MKISELIQKLEMIKHAQGNVEVRVYDRGFEGQTEIEEVRFEEYELHGCEGNTVSLITDF